jgi:hypothetical protein
VRFCHGEANGELKEQVRKTEIAFAKTMAHWDHAAFQSYLPGETIFFGHSTVMRGVKQMAEGWKRYFEGTQAPFSWNPRMSRFWTPARWQCLPVRCAIHPGSASEPSTPSVGAKSAANGRWCWTMAAPGASAPPIVRLLYKFLYQRRINECEIAGG